MKIIGLTGPTGSGKSTVSSEAERLGFSVIDCDKTAHCVTESDKEAIAALEKNFGGDITINGRIDRKILAKRAFASKEATETLNKTVLPFIKDEIMRRIERLKADGSEAVLLDAPTLYESGLDAICDAVIAVLACRETRKKRIMERDGIDASSAELRILAGKPDSYYTERTKHIIYNDGDISEVRRLSAELFGTV